MPDELKVTFIEYVHRQLAKYACDVTRDRRSACPECGKLVKDQHPAQERELLPAHSLKGDGSEIFEVKDERHLACWISQPVDVYLVISQTDELSSQQVIRWMNVTRYLKARKDKKSRQIVFDGEKLDMEAVWKARDSFFPMVKARK